MNFIIRWLCEIKDECINLIMYYASCVCPRFNIEEHFMITMNEVTNLYSTDDKIRLKLNSNFLMVQFFSITHVNRNCVFQGGKKMLFYIKNKDYLQP